MIEISGEQKTQELISIFICEKDRDVENFLKEKAIILDVRFSDENQKVIDLIFKLRRLLKECSFLLFGKEFKIQQAIVQKINFPKQTNICSCKI